MVVLIGATALAVDIGQVTNSNRNMQTVADVIALDTARAITGSQTAAQLSGATGAVTTAALAAAARNNLPVAQLTVEVGTFSTSFTSQATVIANGVTQTVSSTAIPTSVRITAKDSVKFAFRSGSGNTSRSAVALKPQPSAAFSVGSFLAGVTPSAAGNTVLNQVLGDSFNARLVSYNGLAAANVALGPLAIAAGFASPTQLINSTISARNFMLAAAQVLNDGSHAAEVTVLNNMAADVSASTMIDVGKTMKVFTGGDAAAAGASVNVLKMLTAMAMVVDGTHAVSLPQAQVNIPNIGGVDLSLNLIEPAKWAAGPVVGPTIAGPTQQVSATVTPHLTISTSNNVTCSLQSLVSLLTCLLSPVLKLDIDFNSPISLTAASAQAQLTAINCSSTPKQITLQPTLGALNLDTAVDITVKGTLAGVNLGDVLRIHASGGAKTVSNPGPTTINEGSTVSVGSTPLGLAGLTSLSATDVSVLNLGLSSILAPLITPLLGVVNTALGSLDTFISPLLKQIGVQIGGADLSAIAGSVTGGCANQQPRLVG
jgi:uncharacterized membrane protein